VHPRFGVPHRAAGQEHPGAHGIDELDGGEATHPRIAEHSRDPAHETSLGEKAATPPKSTAIMHSVLEQKIDIRLVRVDDAEPLAAHLARDRAAFAQWEPAQPEEYYTSEGQSSRIKRLLGNHGQGQTWPGVVLLDGLVIGQVTAGSIIRGPFRKGSVGYWIASTHQNRGHAKRAVALLLKMMSGELRLHRAEASTQLENHPSQRVLRANSFSPCGIAHSHIFVNGGWRDGVLWELTLAD
jgi:ribosomal-protein-alanine N-acetyltransferase